MNLHEDRFNPLDVFVILISSITLTVVLTIWGFELNAEWRRPAPYQDCDLAGNNDVCVKRSPRLPYACETDYLFKDGNKIIDLPYIYESRVWRCQKQWVWQEQGNDDKLPHVYRSHQ